MNTKKIIWVLAALVVLGFLVFGYGYVFQLKRLQPKPEQKGAIGTTENVSKGVPEIVTNPAAKVPEVNPLDRANPYKYVNPLR